MSLKHLLRRFLCYLRSVADRSLGCVDAFLSLSSRLYLCVPCGILHSRIHANGYLISLSLEPSVGRCFDRSSVTLDSVVDLVLPILLLKVLLYLFRLRC